MTLATAAYAFGNCTYYVATRFPMIYPYLGNALDWVTNAKKQGYTVLSSPAPDTVVVYGPGNGYSSLGHVAVVESVNSDGSFQVSEMNYRGYDLVDQRRSTMKGVVGFVVPPGSSYTPIKAQAYAAFSSASGATPCLHHTDIGILGQGTTICWDGLIGGAVMAAGGILMVGGVLVFALFALKNTGVGKSAAGFIPGPVGMVARSSTPKPKPVAPTPEQGKAASDERMARAKKRLSESEMQSAVDTFPKKRPHTPGVGYSAQKASAATEVAEVGEAAA